MASELAEIRTRRLTEVTVPLGRAAAQAVSCLLLIAVARVEA
jgi:hypothetical protein